MDRSAWLESQKADGKIVEKKVKGAGGTGIVKLACECGFHLNSGIDASQYARHCRENALHKS